jgi:hypothetical protein
MGLANFLPKLTLNLHPPNLCPLRSWDNQVWAATASLGRILTELTQSSITLVPGDRQLQSQILFLASPPPSRQGKPNSGANYIFLNWDALALLRVNEAFQLLWNTSLSVEALGPWAQEVEPLRMYESRHLKPVASGLWLSQYLKTIEPTFKKWRCSQ